jgi:HEAT repeat protein
MSNKAFYLALVAIALVLVEWIWLSWSVGRRQGELAEEVRYLQQEVARLQSGRLAAAGEVGSTGPVEFASANERDDALYQALKRLGDKSIIKRYQAGMTIREYGPRAALELVELVRSGNSDARQAALLLLNDVASPAALAELRQLVQPALARPDGAGAGEGGADLSPKTVAGMLAVLGRHHDAAAVPLFKLALESKEESVRLAGIVGLRRQDSIEALPELVRHLHGERPLVAKEVEKAVQSFCRHDPEQFVQSLSAAPAKSRFRVAALLGKDPSAAALQALRRMGTDADPRVALGVKRLLQLRQAKTPKSSADSTDAGTYTTELQKLEAAVAEGLK